MITGNLIKNHISSQHRIPLLIVLACQIAFLLACLNQEGALALGFISHHASHKLPGKWHSRIFKDDIHAAGSGKSVASRHNRLKLIASANKNSVRQKQNCHAKATKQARLNRGMSGPALEKLISNLQSTTIAPGVIYKKCRGGLRVNALDIDIVQAPVFIKPLVAPAGSTRLQTINSFASANHALAAINANYFKKDGTPLGTLVIDGDWIAGPIYDRVALGISKAGFPRIDKVSLGGILSTSNPEAPKIWVNNINQPHRTGSHIIAYTRRWGSFVHLPYEGSLVAIDAQGKVVDRATRELTIPYGGMVLVDSKGSLLSCLQVGDLTCLRWQVTPPDWQDVTEAISGGPMLIKNGNYCVDLPEEKFRGSWAGSSIKARTACGVTADNHLLLVTVEGTHTIFDLAHILHDLGAVEAMNLDGGGSTTMVVHNATVNIENKSSQRRVAAALGIFQMNGDQKYIYDHPCSYVPRQSLLDPKSSSIDREEQNFTQDIVNTVLNAIPTITAENRAGNQGIQSISTRKAL